ncbi:hypothetical protein Bca101_097407 [Brassica carinata]
MRLGVNRRSSWCMVGDFNEILNNEEKIGGPRRSDASFQPFSDMLHACGMTELPSTGNSYTLTASQDSYRGSFKFDRRMLHKPLVQEAIHQAWNQRRHDQDASVSIRLSFCRKALSKWKKIIKPTQSNLIRCDLLKAYRDEENYWKQKSKDDWIIHGDGNTKVFHAAVFKEVLQKYAEATGQVINLNKSSLTFGKKVDQDLKLSIQNSLGIFAEGGAGTYLGLPECFSGSKVKMLAYIQEKMKGRMSGWYTRFLSQAGKEVILKSVAMAMPIYAMSCFKLPKTTCNNLTSAMAAFRWRSTEDKGKIHWLSWDKLCVPKRLGGMGFKDIETFNQALLANQAWRILHEQSSLFGTFLKSRYFPNGDFLSAKLGLRHMVGNGESIHVWSTPWLADDSHLWNIPKLNDLFYPQDIAIISKIKPVINSEDFYCWNHTRSGEYSVRSGYWFAEKSANKEAYATATVLPSLNGIKDYIWSLDTAPKIKMFLWKAVSGALPVTDNLKKIMFGWKPPPSGWIKCDIGSAWSSSKNESGASWVLRDSDGNVLLHGRRSFSAIYSRMDASMESWLWAIDSLKNLHFGSIIFASDDKDLVAAVTKPSAWPSLKFYSQNICIQLHNFLFWRVQSLKRSDIRGASLIADSVIKEDRYQSYIAAGYPGWLRHLFV